MGWWHCGFAREMLQQRGAENGAYLAWACSITVDMSGSRWRAWKGPNETRACNALPVRFRTMEGPDVARPQQPVARLLPAWRDSESDPLAFLFATNNRERKPLDSGFSGS